MHKDNKIEASGTGNISVQDTNAKTLTINQIDKVIKQGGTIDFNSIPKHIKEQIEADFFYRLNRVVQTEDFEIFIEEKKKIQFTNSDFYSWLCRRLA